jgi:hypothetical protein
VLRSSDRAGLLDQILVGAEGDVSHDGSVHEVRVKPTPGRADSGMMPSRASA